MTDAPERIYAWTWHLPYASKANGKTQWNTEMYPSDQSVTEYIRVDLAAAPKGDSPLSYAPATDPMADPRVVALGEALREVLSDLEIGAHPHLHIEQIRAALSALDKPKEQE